jgi:hypothetical protein
MGDLAMNRWRQRLTEIDGDGALTGTLDNVQFGQLGQDAERASRFVQIEQIEQRPDESAPPAVMLDSDTPDDWGGRIGRLISRPCPDGFARQRWVALCNGAERFARQWAEKALSLGWTFEELFALRDPLANVSLQGAAWFIGDSTVTAVTVDAITLRTASGATQRLYRRSQQ